MTSLTLTRRNLARQAERIAPFNVALVLIGAGFCGVSALLSKTEFAYVALSVGALFLWLALVVWAIKGGRNRSGRQRDAILNRLIANDATPSFITTPDGELADQNYAAVSRFGGPGMPCLLASFEEVFAAPRRVMSDLQSRALAMGAAQEVVDTRKARVRLSVQRIDDKRFLWRFTEVAVSDFGDHADALPMLILSGGHTVAAVNDALRRLIGHDVTSLDRVVTDLPLRAGDVHVLAGAEGRIYARVAVAETDKTGHRAIYFIPETTPLLGGWEAFDALPVALLKVAVDGRLLQSNRPARELLAIGSHQGVSLGELVEGLGRPVQDWVRDVAMGRARKPEFVRASRASNDTFLQITLNRVEHDDQLELIAVISDATELKSLEAKFVQSQKMQAIGQLAGGVAHDFNNLLTAISGHCDLLLLRHDETDVDYSDLVQIHQNANRAASLVGQLLAFSRKQTLKPQVIDLRDTLADLTHLLNRLVGEKVALSLTHDAGLLPIRADKRQLEQVIMNLVVNARDAMPKGGQITIETRNEHLVMPLNRDRATVPAGDYVLVTVSDQGIGIPPERLQKVFEPFFTTKRTGEGTGLGLSTAYGIMKQTGGFIFVDSKVGTGTTFSLYLPAHTAEAKAVIEAAHPPAAPPSTGAERGSGVILLVEDEAPVRAFASRALQLKGYTVLEAESAEEALDLLQDEALHVDLFVSDVIMPGRDGPSWVSEALERRPDVKVVFVSGYAEDHFAEQQSRIPNSVFLPKPFSLSELIAVVQEQF